MSATNSTTHYELPVFIATDKPAWLVDWNGSMNSIDAGIYEAKAAADTAAAGVAANASDISTLSSTVTTQGSSLSTLSDNLTTLTGTVNTITSLIGNGEPTTTDKTIIGAINEINAEITSPTAAGISYDNTTSGLTADDVQEAIDENAAAIATVNSTFIPLPDFTNIITTIATTAAGGYNTTYTATHDCYLNGKIQAKSGVGGGAVNLVDGSNNVIARLGGCDTADTDKSITAYINIFIKAGWKVTIGDIGLNNLTVFGVVS